MSERRSIPKQGHARFEETKRVTRVLQIVQLIHTRPSCWRRAALAARFGISERQIAKDLDVIRHGLCLELASGQDGYAFARAPQLPAVTFSFGEALAIYLAADAVRMVPGVDTTELQVALTRLGGALPVEFQQVMERRTRNALPVQTQVGQRRTALLPVLHAAMFWGRILAVKYASATRGG